MGKAQGETTVSRTFHTAGARLHKQVLLEDGPLKGLHRRDVYVHVFKCFLSESDKQSSVVNPSIRMTWIMKNWEQEWIDGAVKILQDLVSIFWIS